MMEAGVLLVGDAPIYWHQPPDRTVVALPDSRGLWEMMWENRERISGFAHSHPGRGLPHPSYEDATTFAGVEQALGRRLNWWIISEDSFALIQWVGPERLSYKIHPVVFGCPQQPMMTGEPPWTGELHRLSYGTERKVPNGAGA